MNATKYPYPRPPTINEHITMFNSLKGISWSKANVADFWAMGLASVQTKHTSTGRLGWIEGDSDNINYNALDYAALSLVRQYAVMAVNTSDKEIFCVPVKDLLRSIQTFRFEEMSSALKARLIVVEDCTDLFSASLNIHVLYDEEEVPTLPASPDRTVLSLSTLGPDDRACDEFVAIAAKNEVAHAVTVLPLLTPIPSFSSILN